MIDIDTVEATIDVCMSDRDRDDADDADDADIARCPRCGAPIPTEVVVEAAPPVIPRRVPGTRGEDRSVGGSWITVLDCPASGCGVEMELAATLVIRADPVDPDLKVDLDAYDLEFSTAVLNDS